MYMYSGSLELQNIFHDYINDHDHIAMAAMAMDLHLML